MIKVTDIVKDILTSSEEISVAHNRGLLNYSAFAEAIHQEVEEKAKKPVKKGTIVVALSRLARKSSPLESLTPEITIDDLTVKAPLIEFTLTKTDHTLNALRELHQSHSFANSEYMTVTQGLGEITIIATEELRRPMLELFRQEDIIAVIPNLVALTVTFNKAYLSEPNLIYAILRSLAIKKINIIEIVSTYTELTFIVEKKDMQRAFMRLSEVYQK
jgi:aspartokinase